MLDVLGEVDDERDQLPLQRDGGASSGLAASIAAQRLASAARLSPARGGKRAGAMESQWYNGEESEEKSP